MNAPLGSDLTIDLSDEEMQSINGGMTGSPELAYDLGRAVMLVVTAFVVVGAAFYRHGGLTGNPWR